MPDDDKSYDENQNHWISLPSLVAEASPVEQRLRDAPAVSVTLLTAQ
jgi:hypothetical protein